MTEHRLAVSVKRAIPLVCIKAFDPHAQQREDDNMQEVEGQNKYDNVGLRVVFLFLYHNGEGLSVKNDSANAVQPQEDVKRNALKCTTQ